MAQFGTDAGSAFRAGTVGVGLRSVGSYQISGHPFITSSVIAADQEMKISFPYITKKITVVASGSQPNKGLRIHFATTGSGNVKVIGGKHFIALDTHEDSMDFDVKCKEIYLTAPGAAAGFMLYASLTNIPTSSMYAVTGSGVTS